MGGYASGASGSQTYTSEIDLTVNLTKLAVRQDLLVGLYAPTVTGGAFSNLTFDLYVDGVDVIHQAFTSSAAAQAYFTDDPLDLGSLATGPFSGNTLTLRAVMSISSSTTGSGFYTGLIVGDSPAPSGGTSRFVDAMAGLGATSSTSLPSGGHADVAGPMLIGPRG